MLSILKTVNLTFLALFALSYLYQLFYAAIGLAAKRSFAEPEANTQHKFAAVISARNEEGVIGGLIESLKRQRYPAEKLDIFVVADNCTDRTAQVAQRRGATVFRRWNPDQVGKGYALDFLFRRILRDYGDRGYAGYFIFDADNLVDENFVAEMNKTFDRGHYDAITCYRNSKNFGGNWISAGYSMWFLHQARFLNFPRSLLGLSCGVGGTGFFVSDRLLRKNGGWPFHLLTEDIEFTADCAVTGHPIGYCDRAMILDEQPTAFRQSWHQRLRWSKGHYQVDHKYALPLLRGILQGGKRGLTCYDTFLSVSPTALGAVAVVALDLLCLLVSWGQSAALAQLIVAEAGHFLAVLAGSYVLLMLLCAASAVASEWRRIPATVWEKLRYIPLFPLFMLTYIPIAVAAIFRKVEWTPIHHTAEADIDVVRV